MNANWNLIRTSLAAVAVVGALGLAACERSESPPMQSRIEQKSESPGPVVLDDTAITTRVKSALLADDQVKNVALAVNTVDGKVTLSGSVKDPAQRERVIQIARNVQGVKDVEDSITVN